MNLAVFDYGVGNIHSLSKALEAEGARVTVTDDWVRAFAGDALVLPGVGSFDAAAGALPRDRSPIREALADGFPCLGVCLGMQLLFERSEEGEGEGLGIVPGRVRRLRAAVVPQMGWNDVGFSQADPLFRGMEALVAYYANSFVCVPANEEHAVAWSEYGGDRFVAAVRRGRTWGVQFHPEKSSQSGRQLLRNFLEEVARTPKEGERPASGGWETSPRRAGATVVRGGGSRERRS